VSKSKPNTVNIPGIVRGHPSNTAVAAAFKRAVAK